MAWEKYVWRSYQVRPMISIRKCGQIGFNKTVVEKFSVGIPVQQYVVFHYDCAYEYIGLEISDNRPDHSLPIIVNQTGVQVYAKCFLEYFGIPHSHTRKYDIRRCEETGYLIAHVPRSLR